MADALMLNDRRTYVQRPMHLCSSEGGIFLKNAVCLCGEVNFVNCFRGCFSDFMRRIAGYLTNKIGETDRKQTKKNLIEYYFIGKFNMNIRKQPM